MPLPCRFGNLIWCIFPFWCTHHNIDSLYFLELRVRSFTCNESCVMSSWFSPSPYPAVDAPSAAAPVTSAGFAKPREVHTEVRSEARTEVHTDVDLGLVAGLAIAAAAILAGIGSTGISLGYFLQPTGVLIVLGGTLGVTLISSPRTALARALRRVARLLRPSYSASPEATIEELLDFARIARNSGILGIELSLSKTRNPFLRQVLAQALDTRNRAEFRDALETMLRVRERQGENDARVLETAGGFAPTIGVLGTVVGLIDALRHFSDLGSVSAAVGTAFVSTLYGLALANLVFLPVAHRIRSSGDDDSQADELIAEGCQGIYDSVHPTMLRDRLNGYLRADGRVAEGNRRVVALRAALEEHPEDPQLTKMPAWRIPERNRIIDGWTCPDPRCDTSHR